MTLEKMITACCWMKCPLIRINDNWVDKYKSPEYEKYVNEYRLVSHGFCPEHYKTWQTILEHESAGHVNEAIKKLEDYIEDKK